MIVTLLLPININKDLFNSKNNIEVIFVNITPEIVHEYLKTRKKTNMNNIDILIKNNNTMLLFAKNNISTKTME